MPNSEYKKASSFLEGENQDLRFLFSKIKRLQLLNQKVLTYLDPNTAKFTQVGNWVNGTLVLIVSNGGVASQLRYQVPDLIRQFQHDDILKNVKQIECKVRPDSPSPLEDRVTLPNAHPSNSLSPSIANIVREIAESIQDEKIKTSLLHIASRSKIEKLKI